MNLKLISISILACVSAFAIGYAKGSYDAYIKYKVKEKDTLIEAQKDQLKQKDIIIIKERNAVFISNQQSIKYQEQLNKTHLQYEKLRKEWNAKKNHINSTNTITTEWMRTYVQPGVPAFSNATSESNESSPSHLQAHDVGSEIADKLKKGEENAIQVEQLQQWINKQYEEYNK